MRIEPDTGYKTWWFETQWLSRWSSIQEKWELLVPPTREGFFVVGGCFMFDSSDRAEQEDNTLTIRQDVGSSILALQIHRPGDNLSLKEILIPPGYEEAVRIAGF